MTGVVIPTERGTSTVVIPIPTYVGTRNEHHCHSDRVTQEHRCHFERTTQERGEILHYNQQISLPTAVGIEMTVVFIPTKRQWGVIDCHSDRTTQERRGICCYNQQISQSCLLRNDRGSAANKNPQTNQFFKL